MRGPSVLADMLGALHSWVRCVSWDGLEAVSPRQKETIPAPPALPWWSHLRKHQGLIFSGFPPSALRPLGSFSAHQLLIKVTQKPFPLSGADWSVHSPGPVLEEALANHFCWIRASLPRAGRGWVQFSAEITPDDRSSHYCPLDLFLPSYVP